MLHKTPAQQRRRRICMICIFLLAGLIVVSAPIHAQAERPAGGVELPPGFVISEIDDLNFPTDMAFLPSGELLVLEKGTGDGPGGRGQVRVVIDGQLRREPVLILPTNPFGDSGLLGLAVDPDFAQNGYLYIWYATGEESLGWSGETHNRLSRFTLDRTTLTIAPDSERILLDGIPWWIMHNGGGMAFDDDGNLLLSTGDVTDDRSAPDPSVYTGKILRIAPTAEGYAIPADNPYVDNDDALDEVYAAGLRNPFRMTQRASDGRIYVADVGNEAWEEINVAAPAADYGWPTREGPCPFDEQEPCPEAPPEYTDPVLYYPHDGELGASITGLDFYEGTAFPEEYHDGLFLGDLNLGTLDFAVLSDDGFTLMPFLSGAPGIVDVEYHDERLYYLQIIGGKIGMIAYTGVPNQMPVAVAAADVTLGASPLAVQFDASASYDPDGEVVAYRWDFGDGSAPVTETGPARTHVYAEDGTYTASLTVIDDAGAESEPLALVIQAYSGVIPTIRLNNLTEPDRALFHGGDRWEYRVERNGGVDDLDPEEPFVWSVAMHHNQHSHPIINAQVTESAVLEIDTDNHGGAWNIWYRIHLHMNTLSGQQVHVSADLRPALVSLNVASSPIAADVLVNGGRRTTPHQYRAVVGTEHVLAAPGETLAGQSIYAFERWRVEEGAAPPAAPLGDPTLPFTVPTTTTTFVADYRVDRPAETLYLPLVGAE